MLEFRFEGYSKKRIAKGLKLKIIYNEDLRDSDIVKYYKNQKLTEVRFLKQVTPAGVNISGDNVAGILWKKHPYAFVISSKDVADSFREYFNVIWGMAKK